MCEWRKLLGGVTVNTSEEERRKTVVEILKEVFPDYAAIRAGNNLPQHGSEK